MSLKGKAAAIGIGELKPFKEHGDLTALGLMAQRVGRSDRGRGTGEERYRRLPGRRAVFRSGDDLPGQRGRGAGTQHADAESGRYRRRQCRRNDLARGRRDRRGHVQRGAMPRRRSEQGRRPAPAGHLGAARVRGALRKYRRELRLRDDRASPYVRIRHHGAADGEGRSRSADQRAQESAGDFQRQAAHDRRRAELAHDRRSAASL